MGIEMHGRSAGVSTSLYTHYTTHLRHTKQRHMHTLTLHHCMTLGGHRRFGSFLFFNLFAVVRVNHPVVTTETILYAYLENLFAVFLWRVNPQ